MEAPKYYELGNDDTFYVHFANRQGLSIEQIKMIFSEWGKVYAVTKAGDDYGYRFVRYRHEEEVKRCVEGLRNHSTIRLLRPRPSTGQQNSWQRTKQGANSTNCHQDNSTTSGPRNFDASRPRDYDARSDSDVSTVVGRSVTNFGTTKDVPQAGDATNVPEYSREQQRQNSLSAGNLEGARLAFKSEDVPTRPGTSVIASGPAEDLSNIPDLVPATFNDYNQSGGGSCFKNPVAKTQRENDRVVVADQVVVANVPTDFSENLVLHLLRKHEPVSIGPMKLAAYSAIRYCVVFFSNVQQARAAESEFDGRAFAGRNLIVLRP